MKKYCFSLFFLFFLCIKGRSQSAEIYVCTSDGTYQSITASGMTVSDDGAIVTLSGDVSITNISNPDTHTDEILKPKCGGNTGWVCGTAHITTDGDITTVQCQGSTGRCAKVVSGI